jgi:hypothetical protein
MLKPTWIVIGVLAVVCVAEGVVLWRLENRLAELEVTSKRAARERRSARPGLPAEIPTTETVHEIDRRLTVLERSGADAGAGPSAATDETVDGPRMKALESRLEAMVDRKLDERLSEKNEPPLEQKKPSIGELSKAVAMTPEQEDASVRAIDQGKKLAFELLSTPRPDGKSLAEDLVAALADSEDPGKVWAGFIQRLMTERVPGRSETYLAGILKIQRDTWDRLSRTLDADQHKKLTRMGVDILEVRTGYDPFADMISER